VGSIRGSSDDTKERLTDLLRQLRATTSLVERMGACPEVANGRGSLSGTEVNGMSDEVVDTNPYSRLMALQRMGIVKEYERIRECTVAVVGIGGVGSVAAEMLTRCGVGRLLLYDYDVVELANMNRLFFRPQQCGSTKTTAAANTLQDINPDVNVEPYDMNITTLDGFDSFKESLCDENGNSRVDIVLSCVDNYEARMTINQVCLELGQMWMESGVSEDAVSGHIQVMAPGETACFACVPPLIVASGIDERTLKRDGVCSASLPTTMGIIAGLLIQNSLKYLLGFGDVSRYLGYSSLADYFPSMEIRPNPACSNETCLLRQTEFVNAKVKSFRTIRQDQGEQTEKNVPHSNVDGEAALDQSNEWGIEILGACSDPDNAMAESRPASHTASGELPPGVQYAHSTIQYQREKNAATIGSYPQDDVENLMAKLEGLMS
jgi:ubiquitin-like modifier-activating enzyme 5